MRSLCNELQKLYCNLRAVTSPAKIKDLLHNPLFSNAIYLVLSNGMNAIFGFVFWIIAARLYTTGAVGTTSAIISAGNLLETIALVGLNYGIIRFLKSSDNPVKLINSSFTLSGLLSLGATVIFIIGLGFWAPGLNIVRINPLYLIVFLLYVPAEMLSDFTDIAIIACQKTKFIFIHMLVFNIIRLVMILLLVSSLRSFGIFGSWSAATFIALLVGLFLLLPRVQHGYRFFFTVDKKAVSEVIHFSFVNYLSDLVWTAPGFIFPLMTINLVGAESSAYFYVAWAMNGILTIIPLAVSNSLIVEGARDQTMLKIHVRQSFKMLLLMLIPAVLLMMFIGNKLLLFFGDQYSQNASILLRWLAIAAFPLAINMIYFSVQRVNKNIKPIVALSVLMAVIAISISFLLLPRLGINGIGIAWLGAQSVIALIAMIRYTRCYSWYSNA